MIMMENRKKAYFFLILTVSVWGSLYVVSKFVLDKVSPVNVLFFRYLIACPFLMGFLKSKQTEKIEAKDYKYIFMIGFLGYFLSIGAQMLGTKLSNASLASLINAMNPVFILFFASLILKERLTVKKVVAVAAAVAGTWVIVGNANGSGGISGVLISVGSVIMWSWMTAVVRQVTQKYHPITVTAYAIMVATFCASPFAIYQGITLSQTWDWSVFLCLLYMGVIGTALAHMLWNKSLSMIEASSCALFYPLQPLVAVLLGGIFLGERIDLRFIAGGTLIVGGVLFSVIGGGKKEAKRC